MPANSTQKEHIPNIGKNTIRAMTSSEPSMSSSKAKHTAASSWQEANAPSVTDSASSYATYRIDPTREKIYLCVADYSIPEDWMKCVAKFDTGCADDWMSEKLASEIGVELEDAQTLRCCNFDGSLFYSNRVAVNVTWMHDKNKKTICGTFRIGPQTKYAIVIGKRTLFDEKIFSTGEKIPDVGVLTTKRISKEEAEKINRDGKRRKEESDAFLRKQDEKDKERKKKENEKKNEKKKK